MAYILDVMNEKIKPRADRISLERYIVEHSYAIKYLSRLVKDKSMAVYNVLFMLTFFETGKSEISVSWGKIGEFICTEQGNIIAYGVTVKRRLPDLLKLDCIKIDRQRGKSNVVTVHLPSEIPACRKLIEKEESGSVETEQPDDADYYSNAERRLMILGRDKRKCVYCLVDVSEDSYFLDHIVPVSKGGTHKKFNLVTSCEGCNQRKQDQDAIQFLSSNYRSQLINQDEYLRQKEYIEHLLSKLS
jgi:hypothetical protein